MHSVFCHALTSMSSVTVVVASVIPFLCSTLPFTINFLCHDRTVDLAGGPLPHLRLKFR